MGYTNYYHEEIDFTDEEWNQIKSEFTYIIGHAGSEIDVQYNTDDRIQFNGKPGYSCESFYIDKKARTEEDRLSPDQDISLHFCKTRELPYDIYVWHMLVFIKGMKGIQSNDFSIDRDPYTEPYEEDMKGSYEGK